MRLERPMEKAIGILAVFMLIGGATLVIAPFITALVWGAILAFCTWHPFLRLTAFFGGRRGWATFALLFLIFILLLAPVCYAAIAFSTRVPGLLETVNQRLAEGLPPLPSWLERLPFVGPRLDEIWNGIISRNPEIVARLRELAGPILRMALAGTLSILNGVGLLIISILFAAYYYVNGEAAAAGLRAALERVTGRADYLLMLIGSTVKGVVYGVLGTSLVQAILCAIGYWIAGLPSPGLLGLATFFLAILPGGPLLIVVPGAIWLTQNGMAVWAVFLVVWVGVVGFIVDGLIKPVMISKTSSVPFIYVLLGIFGGAAVFGLLGIFVGPTLLAVTHAVVREWAQAEMVEQRAASMEAASNAAVN